MCQICQTGQGTNITYLIARQTQTYQIPQHGQGADVIYLVLF